MNHLYARVREHYEELGADPRPGAAPEQIAAFESARNLRLPRSLAELYLTLNGLDGEVPNFGMHALQLWSLSELTRVSEGVAAYRGIPDYGPITRTLSGADQYLAFGDALCWSHVLAVRLIEPASRVLWICGGAYAEVAPTFDDFWARYLADPDSVLWPGEEQIIAPAG